MSEDDDLMLKIAQLSGRINRKEQEGSAGSKDVSMTDLARKSSRGSHYGNTASRPYRGASSIRGRGSRASAAALSHKNRTLVLNNVKSNGSNADASSHDQSTPTSTADNTVDQPSSTTSWIAKHDRHKQLINPAIYDREIMVRARKMEETRKLRARRRDERERWKLNQHWQRLSSQRGSVTSSDRKDSAPMVYEITLHGIRFRVTNGGSRLLKIPDDLNSSQPTPKTANVGGVIFVRSKNGNLYRSGVVKARKSGTVKKIDELCKRFTTTGSCSKGPLCPYTHDPNKVAICKAFLQTGSCPAGESCDLSHDPTPQRVPACLHFLKGNCSNPSCRYAHVRVNPGAPVCREFATLGFCEKGADCSQRHVHECPDYANSGICNNKKCRLPHIDRAGQIRKSATAATADSKAENGKGAQNEDESDVSSDDDDPDGIDSDDVDSDGLTEDFIGASADSGGQSTTGGVSAQSDYIHL